jgi:hypothetical protein
MLTRYLTLIGLIAALSIFSACQGTGAWRGETLLEKNWGKSFESAKKNQILNPDAGKNLDPVTGLDGEAADMNMEKYRESFKEKPPQQTYDVNLGSISKVGN